MRLVARCALCLSWLGFVSWVPFQVVVLSWYFLWGFGTDGIRISASVPLRVGDRGIEGLLAQATPLELRARRHDHQRFEPVVWLQPFERAISFMNVLPGTTRTTQNVCMHLPFDSSSIRGSSGGWTASSVQARGAHPYLSLMFLVGCWLRSS